MDMVDTHPHVVADDTKKYPLTPIGGKMSVYAQERPNTTEQYLALMDETGITQAALVQSSTGHGYDNSYMADSVDKYPDRFAGVTCVDAQAPDAGKTLRYWIADRGMSGVRLFTAGSTMNETDWLDKPGIEGFWEAAEDLKTPVCIQIRWTGLHMLRNILERYPNITFIVDHLAGAKPDDGPPFAKAQPFLDLAQYPHLYMKFTTRNITDAGEGKSTVEEWFGKLIELFGADHIMWGSNYPSAPGPIKPMVDLARKELSVLPEEHQRWLLAETARNVYPKLKTGAKAKVG
jgi:predicted TIM-barrel fold metal-dependent hydrolase